MTLTLRTTVDCEREGMWEQGGLGCLSLQATDLRLPAHANCRKKGRAPQNKGDGMLRRASYKHGHASFSTPPDMALTTR